MKMKNTTGCLSPTTPAQNVSREQIAESRQRLEHEFSRLLHAESPLLWKGTRSDLMELVYLIYVNGNFRDADGYPLSMAELTRRVCRVFDLPAPYNPYERAARAMNRKGLRRHRLLERYAWLYCVAGVEHPLEQFIGKGGRHE